jgi:hypothetical protein
MPKGRITPPCEALPFAPFLLMSLTGSSGAEFCSAFRSAAGKDLAAVGCAHSLPEAVLLAALTFFGLIGTKHVSALLSHHEYSTSRGAGRGSRSRTKP